MKHVTTYCRLHNKSGQSSVEFAIVLGALLSIVICIGAFNNLFSDGRIFDHVISCASHSVGSVVEGVVDVFSF